MIRVPAETNEEAKQRIAKKRVTFVRWARPSEPKPDILNRLFEL
jgi:hypothetical protein